MKYIFLLVLCLVLVSCGPCKDVTITDKSYIAPSLGSCIKVGNTWMPMNGGTCFGMVEQVPAKYIVSFSDGSYAYSKSLYVSKGVGDSVCR